MSKLTDLGAAKIIGRAGFSGPALVEALAIAMAESGLDPAATNTAGNTPPSTDRGLFQINSYYHPEVTDACAFNALCNAKAAYKISGDGTSFEPWSTYTNGAYKAFLPRAQATVLALSAPTLSLPFDGSYPVTQPFGRTAFAGEPPGFIYPDGSLDYLHNDGTATRYPHCHAGIDYALPGMSHVVAAGDGTASFAGQDQTGFGTSLTINHGSVTTLYGHLASIAVKLGAAVKRGQTVALSNNTGNSTGPHLHFSVIRNSDGRYVDPAPLLNSASTRPPKPANAVHWVTSSAVTMNDGNPVRVFSGPSDKCFTHRSLEPNTPVSFEAWIHSDPHWDASVNQWDTRWYYIPGIDGGWVASARVNGSPAGSKP